MNIPVRSEVLSYKPPSARGDMSDIGHSHIVDDFSEIRDIIGLLRRQARLIVVTILVVLAIAAAATQTLTPISQATALILFDPQRKNLLDLSTQAQANISDISARVDSEVEIIGSDGMLLQVVEAAALVDDPEFAPVSGLWDSLGLFLGLEESSQPSKRDVLGQTLEKLKQRVSVLRRGHTHVITVEIGSENPEKAAKLANLLAEIYISRQVRTRIDAISTAQHAILQEIEPARKRVVDAGTQASQYLLSKVDDIIALTGRSDLERRRDDISQLIAQRGTIAAARRSLRAQIGKSEWNALAESHANGDLTRAAIAGDERLTEGTERLQSLQSDLVATNSALRKARRELVAAIDSSDLPPNLLAEFHELQQRAINASGQYQLLLARQQVLDSEASLQQASSVIVSEAAVPTRAAFPDKTLIMALAGLVSLAAGIGVAFVFEIYVGGFTSSSQLEAVLRKPLATSVPSQGPAQANTVADLPVSAPLSQYAESIRRLRLALHAVLHRSADAQNEVRHRGSVILVSSALSGEGRTSVGLALARTYALSGQRVLILDCDLRQPGVHHLLAAKGSTALVDVLAGNVTEKNLSMFLVNDPKTSLTSIGGASHAKLPSDQLVASKSLQRIVDAARENFDYVIVDSPPIGSVVDGLYLADHADAIVFVIQWARTPQRAVVNAINRLEAIIPSRAEILMVLNRDSD
jgi:succinoglycan biosynthesis transport protein ExoP